MGGLRNLTGEPDRPPSRVGLSLGDELAGLNGFIGGLLALRARDLTGNGQLVDVAIFESVLAMSEALIADYAVGGVTRERTGSILPGVAPSNLYPTLDDGQVIVAANQDSVFARLTEAMGRPELAHDERFATHVARGARQGELDQMIADWTLTMTSADLVALLDAHGVPVGKIYRAADMLEDAHFRARESVVDVPDPHLGAVPMQNVFPKLSDTPGSIRWTGGSLGEHQAEVLRDWLGIADGAVTTPEFTAEPEAMSVSQETEIGNS